MSICVGLGDFEMVRIASAMFALALIAAADGPALAQQPSPPAGATATPQAPTSEREQRRAARKEARKQKRTDCADQARLKKLRGDARKEFMKTCVTN
jgi:hypothetical protein